MLLATLVAVALKGEAGMPILESRPVENMPIAKGKATVAMPILAGGLSSGRFLSALPPKKTRLGP